MPTATAPNATPNPINPESRTAKAAAFKSGARVCGGEESNVSVSSVCVGVALALSSFFEEFALLVPEGSAVALAEASSVADASFLPPDDDDATWATELWGAEVEAAGLETAEVASSLSAARMGLRRRTRGRRRWVSVTRMMKGEGGSMKISCRSSEMESESVKLN